MTDALTALDATFLELEQLNDGALMGIGGVMVFDPAPGGGAPTVEAVCASVGAVHGSTSRRLAHTARCPLLVLPRAAERSGDSGNAEREHKTAAAAAI